MKVYVVKRICDLEYGRTCLEEIFLTEEQAQQYVEENQELDIIGWVSEKQIPLWSYEEWEVK